MSHSCDLLSCPSNFCGRHVGLNHKPLKMLSGHKPCQIITKFTTDYHQTKPQGNYLTDFLFSKPFVQDSLSWCCQTGGKRISRSIFGQLTWNLLWVLRDRPLTQLHQFCMALMPCWLLGPFIAACSHILITVIVCNNYIQVSSLILSKGVSMVLVFHVAIQCITKKLVSSRNSSHFLLDLFVRVNVRGSWLKYKCLHSREDKYHSYKNWHRGKRNGAYVSVLGK